MNHKTYAESRAIVAYKKAGKTVFEYTNMRADPSGQTVEVQIMTDPELWVEIGLRSILEVAKKARGLK